MDRYLSSVVSDTITDQTVSPNRQKLYAKRMKSGQNRASSKRKSLQILQPSAQQQCLLVGVDGVISQSNKPKKTSGKRKVLGDGIEGRPRKQSRSNEELVENEATTSESKAKTNNSKNSRKVGSSTRVEPSEPGQKPFAIFEDPSSASSDDSDQEKRTKTAEEEAYELMVQDAVPESYWKQLAEQRREALDDSLRENEQLHDEVVELKEENSRLKIMADQAEYLASVVQELMGDEDGDKTEESSKQNGETCQTSTDQNDKLKCTETVQEKDNIIESDTSNNQVESRDSECADGEESDDEDL